MGLRDEITSYLDELEADLADEDGLRPSIIWKGITYPCVYSTERRGTEIVRGGHAELIQLTAKIRKELMPFPITVDSTIDSAITLGDRRARADLPQLLAPDRARGRGPVAPGLA